MLLQHKASIPIKHASKQLSSLQNRKYLLPHRSKRQVVQAVDGAELEQKLLQNPVLLKAVNALSVFITKSPLNELKKRWFQRLAGEYDQAETQQRIRELIDDNPVSFGCKYDWCTSSLISFA